MGSSELELGLRLLRGGRAEEAAAVLRPASTAASPNLQVLLALGSAERAAGRVERAAEAFQRAAELDPRSAAAWFNLGLARRDQANAGESALAFAKAAELDPADFDAVQNVVTTLGAAVRRGERPFEPPDAAAITTAKEGVSIVACSNDASRLARFAPRTPPPPPDRGHGGTLI